MFTFYGAHPVITGDNHRAIIEEINARTRCQSIRHRLCVLCGVSRSGLRSTQHQHAHLSLARTYKTISVDALTMFAKMRLNSRKRS